jgi:signal transduction histidine kinase
MRSFSARLAALTFRHRSGLRFEYRLLGHHENWVETAGTEIRYSSIPPGKYVLEARAVWPRGEPAVSALRIRVAVPAPFWMTWPARAALGLLALVLLRAVWGWRVRALKERQRWLEEAVRERTRQLQSEKERTAEALARAEQASRFKSEFLARMSHEIRTPMHGVIGTADLLMGSRLDPSQQELVRTLKESAAVLMNLLNDILDLSRVEAGKLSLAVRPFDLAALVQTVAGLMQPIAKKKGLDLRVSLPAGPLWFAGDGHRVQQILLNLVSNAVKFTHAGFVEVAVAAPAQLYGKGFELIVRDTGCGIPPDRIDSIFQPFVQVGGDPAAAAAGTGLGLSVAKALVDAMGGMIEVDSRPGHGSTFRVRLPLAAAEPVPEPAPAASAPSSAPLRVLVVEDNPVNRQLIARMLAVLGHQAEAAPDGGNGPSARLPGCLGRHPARHPLARHRRAGDGAAPPPGGLPRHAHRAVGQRVRVGPRCGSGGGHGRLSRQAAPPRRAARGARCRRPTAAGLRPRLRAASPRGRSGSARQARGRLPSPSGCRGAASAPPSRASR